MKRVKTKSLILALIVFSLSLAMAQSSGAMQNTGNSTATAPISGATSRQSTDTLRHKKVVKTVRNRDLPYNSDAELNNAGSPANVMHERSGSLDPGRDFKQGDKGQKGDTINLKGEQPNP